MGYHHQVAGRGPNETLPLHPVSRLIGTVAQSRYRIERLLGTGGIGEVYEAADLVRGSRVAIKTLLPAFRQVSEAVRRFEREAKAGGLLDHPNIVEVSAFGLLDDGTPYLVMELVRGIDLAAVLRDGPIALARALAIARQTLDGLGHAHAHGVLHRDLKPANLMITTATDGTEVVKILDLGLAKLVGLAAAELGADKLTATGAIFGTPEYMAPEQALSRPPCPGTDLYAVGVILFEMIAGRAPFVGTEPRATMRLHVKSEVPALNVAVPHSLEAIVKRSLAKRPEDRFANAAEMIAAIAAVERSLA